MKTTYRHVGITTNVADWTDEEAESALALLQGWEQPNAPTDIPGLKARAEELRRQGYHYIPPCTDADERGVCPGHEAELWQSTPVYMARGRNW